MFIPQRVKLQKRLRSPDLLHTEIKKQQIVFMQMNSPNHFETTLLLNYDRERSKLNRASHKKKQISIYAKSENTES